MYPVYHNPTLSDLVRKPDYLSIFVEPDGLVVLTEALTAQQQIVLADDRVTVHATAAATASSAILLRVSVPKVVSHTEY